MDYVQITGESKSRSQSSIISRIDFLDGLRGFAAVQVVLLHYIRVFAPAVAEINPKVTHPAWQNIFIHSPLFSFFDGYLAVSLFFLISGLVLTNAFRSDSSGFFAQSVRRLIRLGLPMAASILLAAVLFWLLPHAHVEAGGLLVSAGWLSDHGGWLGGQGPAEINIETILRSCGL